MSANIKPTAEQQVSVDRLTNHLKTLRAAAGLSQQELAKTIGIGRKTYMGYENGRLMMPWNVYLAIMCFFIHCDGTKRLLAPLGLQIPNWPTTNSEQ